MATVSLKLLVDKARKQVVFAESGKDFVDVLFSFLTLPLGTIVRLLDKRSSLGCMDKIYESVENLDAEYFATKACKTMLLWPRSAAEILCEDLRINADDSDPRIFYSCPSSDCFIESPWICSSTEGVLCDCDLVMDAVDYHNRSMSNAEDGVFLKGAARFIISDDLQVELSTIEATLSLLQKFGIKDAKTLETRVVHVYRKEVLGLLKMLLQSKTPLTDVFLRPPDSLMNREEEDSDLVETVRIKQERENAVTQPRKIKVNLLLDKCTNKVLYAEAGGDFVDNLLSFLTFPLGSTVKLLQKHSSVGCVDNLYRSVEVLGAGGNCIKSEECKNMLLAPILFPHFNCADQLLAIKAKLSESCECGMICTLFTELNPKLPNIETGEGGGFSKQSVRFMVSSDLVITPLSLTSAIDVVRDLDLPISRLIKREATLGESEALNLLRACMTSRNALDNDLQPKKQRKKSL